MNGVPVTTYRFRVDSRIIAGLPTGADASALVDPELLIHTVRLSIDGSGMVRLQERQSDPTLTTALVSRIVDGDSRLLSTRVEVTSLSDAPLSELELPTNVVDGSSR